MTAEASNTSKWLDRIYSACRGGIHLFCLWALPAAVVLFSIAAFTGFPSLYPEKEGRALYFRNLPLEAEHQDARSTIAALETLPQKREVTLQTGAWILLDLPERAKEHPTAVDFPSRNVESMTCWRRDTLQELGTAQGRVTTGAMRNSRMGYALMLGQNEADAGSSFDELVCRASYAQPTSFTTSIWSIPDLRAASDRYHRGVALLDGALVTLALFLTIIALRNREWALLLLAVWLVGNWRLGTYALGWDGQWLGASIPTEWRPFVRNFTIASYFLVTLTLFAQLFRNRATARSPWVQGLMALGALQLVAAFVLDTASFTVLSSVIWSIALAIGLITLLRRLMTRPQAVVSWRFLSLGVALAVILSGLVLALIGQQELLDSFSSVVALLLSNVMVAMVVSDVVRAGRRERMQVQTDLVTSYAVAPLALFTLDSKGRFLHINPILRDMLQIRGEQTAPLHWRDFFAPQDWEAVAAATQAGKDTEISFPPNAKPGSEIRHFALRVVLAEEQIEGSLQDITVRAQAMNALREMVDNDSLTLALNRRGTEKQLQQALMELRLNSTPCSLAYMDLDHFKRINGLFGHTSGDEILKQITDRIRAILTGDQVIGRIGSDEFVILFPNMTSSDARGAAERIIADLNGTSYRVGQRHFHVRAAIGVLEVNPSMDPSAAISAATRACRDARKQHQDVVVYAIDSTELEAHTEELRLFDQLEGGTSPKGLYLEMQPIMALSHPDETLNFEILLRVKDSQGRVLPTGKIVSTAEESGTISIIDKWVVSATLEWLTKHEDRLRKTQFVNVNLSGVSLNDDKFIKTLFQLLSRHSHLTRRLCVEITEGVALQDLDRTRQLIARLQSMGVRVALDDFGAGYTSFSYLKQLGADALKIDGTFVRDMLTSDANVAIVRTIAELAQNLGMMSIAEWVEDPRALEILREIGVDYVQGYAVSAALTPMEILDAELVSDLVANAETLAYIRRNSPPPSLGLAN